MERAQEGILDPHHMCAGRLGGFLAARRIGAVAPDQHVIIRPRFAKGQVMACKLQNAADPAVGQEPASEIVRPPGLCGSGGRILGVARHAGPYWARLLIEPAVASVPVSAPITWFHWANGATVT